MSCTNSKEWQTATITPKNTASAENLFNNTRLSDMLCYRRPGYVAILMMKSKIHRATITQADLHYERSITYELLQDADILPYEMVHVYNISNGRRLETYALESEEDSGVICLNGAAARKGAVGDLIIITTYATYEGAELGPTRTPRWSWWTATITSKILCLG